MSGTPLRSSNPEYGEFRSAMSPAGTYVPIVGCSGVNMTLLHRWGSRGVQTLLRMSPAPSGECPRDGAGTAPRRSHQVGACRGTRPLKPNLNPYSVGRGETALPP